MSVTPYYFPALQCDPRFLPQTGGPSTYPAETRFVACPANQQPWGALHVRPVFLPLKTCKPRGKKGASPHTRPLAEILYVSCGACKYRAFFYGQFWVGVSRAEIVRNYGHGVAVDDYNCYF